MNKKVSLLLSRFTVSAAVIFASAAIFIPAAAFAEDKVNLLSTAAPGDWAEYSITRQNETVPLMSFENQKHWRTVSDVGEPSVRIDDYIMFGDRRSSALGRPVSLDKPFEPIAGMAEAAAVTVVSESAETLTLGEKSYACTKIERKIVQPIDEEKLQPKWEGTSTIWICPDVPVGGLVKMENKFVEQLMPSIEANTIVETWVLTDFGFKNWKE
jgi:hypothetical protein